MEDLIDHIHFDKMIPRAHGTDLFTPARFCALRDFIRIRSVQGTRLFGPREIGFRRVPIFQRPT